MPESFTTPTPPRSRIWATLKALVRTRVTTGLLVILPLVITFWLVKVVFEIMRDSTRWMIDKFLRYAAGDSKLLEAWGVNYRYLEEKFGDNPTPEQVISSLPWWVTVAVDVFSVFLALFILYVIGLLAANVFGKRIIYYIELLLERLPFVKTVYRAIKQVMSSLGGEQMQNLRRVAIVPFMSPHVRTLGFITNVFNDPKTGEELCTVLYFTTINPSTGFMLICKRKDVIELDWSVEDGVRMLLSGGLSLPAPISLTNADGTPHVIGEGPLIPPTAVASDLRVRR